MRPGRRPPLAASLAFRDPIVSGVRLRLPCVRHTLPVASNGRAPRVPLAGVAGLTGFEWTL